MQSLIIKRFILSVILLLSINGNAQKSIRGFIYEDVNQNGKKDKREIGIQGVSVSNGIQVVQTDENGRYELPQTEDQHIFVIKPSQYKFKLNEFNLPKFYVPNKPNGSKDDGFKYPGFEPTPKLPNSVDFGLIPQNESTNFSAFIFGDPQPYTLQELDFFKKGIVEDALKFKKNISFGISLGDLVGDDLSMHTPYKEIMKLLEMPWHNVIGNHDLNFEAKEDLYSDETFEKNFGPTNYAFNYADAHFIVLDNVLYPNPINGKGYLGGFRKDQIEFLKNNLKYVDKNKLLVISYHIPLFIENEDHFDPESRQAFLDLIQDYANILLLSAHTHCQMQQFYTEKQGWKGSSPLHEYNVGTPSGDWYSGELNSENLPISTMRDGTPKGYAFLEIKGNQYVLDYKVAGKPKEYKMEIYSPHVISDKGWNTSMVVANVFMGSEKDQVEYRIDNGEWKPMKKFMGQDPSFYASVQKWDLSKELLKGRRPSNPIESTHLWSTAIPNNLGLGEHRIEIRVKDMFGRIYSDSKTYRIESKK